MSVLRLIGAIDHVNSMAFTVHSDGVKKTDPDALKSRNTRW